MSLATPDLFSEVADSVTCNGFGYLRESSPRAGCLKQARPVR